MARPVKGLFQATTRRDDLHAPARLAVRARYRQAGDFPTTSGKAARARLAIAISLGVISILGGLLLAATDIIRGTVTWPDHSPVSAAPLFLVAAAIAGVSIGRPANSRHGVLRLVAVLAFTAWGTAQVAPDPAAVNALNDAAILRQGIWHRSGKASEAAFQLTLKLSEGSPIELGLWLVRLALRARFERATFC